MNLSWKRKLSGSDRLLVACRAQRLCGTEVTCSATVGSACRTCNSPYQERRGEERKGAAPCVLIQYDDATGPNIPLSWDAEPRNKADFPEIFPCAEMGHYCKMCRLAMEVSQGRVLGDTLSSSTAVHLPWGRCCIAERSCPSAGCIQARLSLVSVVRVQGRTWSCQHEPLSSSDVLRTPCA